MDGPTGKRVPVSMVQEAYRAPSGQTQALGTPRLMLDLDRCAEGECEECRVECDYFYHPGNEGVLILREIATYHAVCRRCRHPHCIDACPTGALKQGPEPERVLRRHLNLCVACRSCSHACPYGTIFPDLLPYHVSNCDLCVGRFDGKEPLCLRSCQAGALSLPPPNWQGDEKVVRVGAYLVVRSSRWRREKA